MYILGSNDIYGHAAVFSMTTKIISAFLSYVASGRVVSLWYAVTIFRFTDSITVPWQELMCLQ